MRLVAPPGRILSVDIIRVVAIIGVVSIHTLTAVYERPDFYGGTVWWISNLWNALARPAIPLFVMLSGWLLLSKSETNIQVWRRIIFRLAIPFGVFFVFFQYWDSGNLTLSNLTPSSLFGALLQSQVGILYFLILMMGLYILLPLLRKVFQTQPVKIKLGVTVAAIILATVATAGEYLTATFIFDSIFLIWAPYVGYFLFGSLIRDLTTSALQKKFLLLVYGIAVVLSVYLSYIALAPAGNSVSGFRPLGSAAGYFDHPLAPNVVVMSLSLFALLAQLNTRLLAHQKRVSGGITCIATASFGMYLFHLIVISFLEHFLGFAIDTLQIPLAAYLAIKFTVAFSMALIISVLVKKSPLLRPIIGDPYSKH